MLKSIHTSNKKLTASGINTQQVVNEKDLKNVASFTDDHRSAH